MMIELKGSRSSGKSVMAYEIMSNINLNPIIVDANKGINKTRFNYISHLREDNKITGKNTFKGIGVGNILTEEDYHFGTDEIYLFELDDYPKNSGERNLMKKAILKAIEHGAHIIYTLRSDNSKVTARILI